MTLQKDSVEMLAQELGKATGNIHLVCQLLADGTRNEFGLLLQGSARLSANTPCAQHLSTTIENLCRDGIVKNIITGGGPGLMEVSNRAARNAGAKSWGIGIKLSGEQDQTDFSWQDYHINAGSLEPRLLVMGALADAVLFARPGIGTMYELMWWLQRSQFPENAFNNPYPWNPRVSIGFEMRPLLICVGSVYNHLQAMLAQMADSYRTINPEDQKLIHVVDTCAEAEELIREHRVVWDSRRAKLRSESALLSA